MRRSYRLLAVGLLVLLVLGLGVHYAGAYDDNWPYPPGDDLATDADAFAGEEVLVIEEVEELDEATGEAVLEVEDEVADEAHELEAELDGVGVDEGGVVQVLGELGPDGEEILVEEVVVVEEGLSDELYKYLMSGLGVVFAAGFFLWHWRIDWRGLRFLARGEADG